MRHTVVGVVASADGLAYDPTQHRRAWSTPAAEVRTVQAQRIPVDVEHSHRWVGEIVYLERHAGNLWAVAEVDTEPTVAVKVGAETVDVPTELYYSAERTPLDEDILLRSVALTRAPARVGARPLTWFAGGLGSRSGWVHDNPLIREIIARAAEANYTRHGGPLIVHDNQPHQLPAAAPSRSGSAHPLMLRSAETLDVSERARTIDLIVAPYNTPARVRFEGRMVTESFAPTAFDGIERQTNKVRANRDHDERRTVGVATRLDPRDRRGLRAEVQIARTPLGDETLALAADDCLDASAAFRPLDMRWQGRSAYTVTKAWLGHVALVPDPAYIDARVLAVHEGIT